MIRSQPDPSLTLAVLESRLQDYRREVASAGTWYFREKYIDRGPRDPFYILDFRSSVEDPGDDTLDEELFQTRTPALRFVSMTRSRTAGGHAYWQRIDPGRLIARLDNFLAMFREDYLQPPGTRADRGDARSSHEILRGRRFLFEIRSPRHTLTGVGPQMYAGLGLGAVRGRLADETGAPLAGAIVEIVAGEQTISRTTDPGGLFWFSRVPPGRYALRVKDKPGCQVRIVAEESFGNVRGWLTDDSGNPLENAEIKLIAPDAEEFAGWSDAGGRFVTGPLPAFSYLLRIPGRLCTLERTLHGNDAVLGGVLRALAGDPLGGQLVVLKQAGAEVRRTTTDPLGNFRFAELPAGRYRLEVPGQKISVREIPG
ncbi:MAG: carboxypeptidase-like regulatory domain-containing protein [Acidobacteriota bacterium]